MLFAVLSYISLLNRLTDSLSRREHLGIALFAFILYYCIGYLKEDSFFMSRIIQWIVIYTVLGYMWKYMQNICMNRTINVRLLIVSFLSSLIVLYVYNALCLRVHAFDGHISHWYTNANPFIVFGSFACINLCSMDSMHSDLINSLSKHCLNIYLLHENLLFRTLHRRSFVLSIHSCFHVQSPIVLVLISSSLLLCISFACSYLVMIITSTFIK